MLAELTAYCACAICCGTNSPDVGGLEITDEQAIEKLLGFKPKTDINFMKALLFMRETAETLGVGGNIDWQTKIQLGVLHQLIEEKRRELKQQLNSTNPFDSMADMNTKGTM